MSFLSGFLRPTIAPVVEQRRLTQNRSMLTLPLISLFAWMLACTRADNESAKAIPDTSAMSAALGAEAVSHVVVLPGLRDTVELPPITRYCTLMQGPRTQRLTDLFGGGDTSLIFRPQSAQAARSRSRSIKGRLGGVLTETQWEPGQTIRIGFINGDPSLQQRVMAAAAEWTQFANLTLTPAPSLNQAEIRV